MSIIYHKDKKRYKEDNGRKCIMYYSIESFNDLISIEKNAFTFYYDVTSESFKEKLTKFIKFIKTEKISKMVMCTSTGLKLAVTYKKGLFGEELILDEGLIKTSFNKEEEIKNEYRAEHFINKYFKKDDITIFGIDTGW